MGDAVVKGEPHYLPQCVSAWSVWSRAVFGATRLDWMRSGEALTLQPSGDAHARTERISAAQSLHVLQIFRPDQARWR
ncbi:hypothetical protein Y887_06240 [Xanthomonas pisi DSM 18956]|uniref:Uncharacterized protein n=1 Tax=Xanthomonas pisi TaxID=56457 RepID=A0A2S7D691_9XANT|nr:hypothetical protein [Xanthomonas pisi]KLD71518.1 hypothetical protein Y887_06240 [Xanthomonas pisi DSM 18956]PPU69327.1 hypothetical protein XpiCFBP4643_04000 [Xanthomonas pisi]